MRYAPTSIALLLALALCGLAVASLVCWIGTITSGRFLAYTYSRLMAGL